MEIITLIRKLEGSFSMESKLRIEVTPEEQSEINKSIIQIIFELLYEKEKITSEEMQSLINIAETHL